MQKKIMLLFLFLLLTSGCFGCQKKEQPTLQLEEIPLEEEQTKEEEKEIPRETIFVYVCGAVGKEGVYELPAGSRVYEAVEKAGGFAENAAVTSVNQAALVKDEQQLYIPTEEEMESAAFRVESEKDGRVNLNSATKEELMTLPGIGEAKAESIVKYREERGAFQSIEDIQQITGIKSGVFEKIKEFITV